jgi:hypothetical protein
MFRDASKPDAIRNSNAPVAALKRVDDRTAIACRPTKA